MKSALAVLLCVILVGCAEYQPTPRPLGAAILWGHLTGFQEIQADRVVAVLVMEIDGKKVEGKPAGPIYLSPGKHTIGIWVRSSWFRVELFRFDSNFEQDATYRLNGSHVSGPRIDVELRKDGATGAEPTGKWSLVGVDNGSQPITFPMRVR